MDLVVPEKISLRILAEPSQFMTFLFETAFFLCISLFFLFIFYINSNDNRD